MINDEELSSLLDIDSELCKIISDLKNKKDISSIYKSLLTWKIGHIMEVVQKKEEELLIKSSNHQRRIIKKNALLFLLALIIIGVSFYARSWIITPILIAMYLIICLLAAWKSKCKNLEYAFISIKRIYQSIEQIKKCVNEKKVIVDKEYKRLQEELVLQIFNQANLDLEEMTCTENINLNFKDRAYRNFIINLYDLKINEKELNNFYRKVVRIILLDDLSNSIEY